MQNMNIALFKYLCDNIFLQIQKGIYIFQVADIHPHFYTLGNSWLK